MTAFAKSRPDEFSDLYIMDLKGSDVRRNPKISGTTHNVFGIQTGVAIGFSLFARKGKLGELRSIHYARREDAEVLRLTNSTILREDGALDHDMSSERITPDAKRNNWLNQTNSHFASLIPLADRQTKLAKTADDETGSVQAVLERSKDQRATSGCMTFDFQLTSRTKALFFADKYNELLERE